MSTHRETGTIDAAGPTDDTVQRLLEFYLTNGYQRVDDADDSAKMPAGSSDARVDTTALLDGVELQRGEPGAGWWTSKMTELHTRVAIDADNEQVDVTYEIDTSGQLLNEVEQRFWRRELQWARRYVREESATPRDLRPEEARRAEQHKSDLRSMGLWGAVAAFVAIVVLALFGVI